MKTNKMLILLITISVMSINVFSQNAMGKYENNQQNCTKFLNLNEQQQKKFDELNLTHQKEMLNIKNQINEKQAKKTTLETSDNADIKAINKINEEIGKLQTEKMNLCSNHKQEIRKILDPNQKIKFDTNCANNKMGNGCCGKMGNGNCKKNMGDANKPCGRNSNPNCPKNKNNN